MAERKHFPSIALQLGTACAVCSFVLLTMQDFHPENYFYPLALLPYALLIYPMNVLFLRKERTMRGVAILNAAAGIIMFVSIALLGSYDGWAALIFVAVFCLFLTLRGCQSAMSEPNLRSVMLCMELSLAVLVVFTAYAGFSEMELIWCLPAICGSAVSILGVMLSRMERSPGLRGWLFVALVFLLIFALLWVLVSFAAAPAGQGLVALWNALVDAVKFVLGLIWKFIVFLISLLPHTEYEEELPPPAVFEMPEYQEYTQEQLNIMGALAFVGVVAAIIGLIYLLRYLATIKAGGKKLSPVGKSARRRVPLARGIYQLLANVWASMCLRVRIWRCRNTPKGLLCILIRKCRMGPWHKTPGETPREFLSRLRHASRHDESLRDALDELIPLVDKAVYAPNGANEPFRQAGLIRRRIGRAVRGQFVRRVKKRIRAKLSKA